MSLAFRLALLAGANLFAGFLLQWFILVTLGAGLRTDALFAGMAAPQLVLSVVAGSMMNVIVPLLASENDRQARQDGWRLGLLTMVVFGVLAAALAMLAPLWTPVVAPGFSAEGRALLVSLTRIQLVGMVFTALAGVLWAVHRARQRFLWPETAPLVGTTVGWIVLLATIAKYDVFAAAWVQVIRVAIHALLLLPGLGRFDASMSFRPDAAREAWRRLRPLMAGAIYLRTEPVVDRMLSSLAPAGDLSLYAIGQQLYVGVSQVCNNALVAPMVTRLARYAHDDAWDAFRRTFRRSLLAALAVGAAGFVTLTAGVGAALGALAGSGDPAPARAWTFFWILCSLAGCLIAGPASEVVRGAFYAQGETRLPVKTDLAVYTAGIGMKAVAFTRLGVAGVGVGASLQVILNFAVLVFLQARQRGAQRVIPS